MMVYLLIGACVAYSAVAYWVVVNTFRRDDDVTLGEAIALAVLCLLPIAGATGVLFASLVIRSLQNDGSPDRNSIILFKRRT